MATEIKVPTLGESVTEATIGEFLKNVGDAVAVDEPIVSLETDKVAVEAPSPVAGVIKEFKVEVGDTVEVGAVLAVIEEGGGRFFGTIGLGTCWTDVLEQEPLGDDADLYFVAGTLYCIAPLPEVNGSASVTLDGVAFRGFADRGAS